MSQLRTSIVLLRTPLLFFAIVVGAFAVYTSNQQTLASYDSAPNSLLGFNLLQEHRLDFDLFRGSYFSALGGQYAFVEAPNGHLTSVFPIGTAILTLPFYALVLLAHGSDHAAAINSAAFEPFRQQFEKMVAAAVAALSVGIFFFCAREIANPAQAGIATVVYALATSIWSIGSQALWQHGPVNLTVLAMVYTLFRANSADEGRTRSIWLLLAGIFAGFLPVIRPTAMLFSLAGFVFVLRTFPRSGLLFAASLALGATPGVAWNAYFFHSVVGGYAGNANSYIASPHQAFIAFWALLASPSRGVFTFSPVLAFSVFGFINAWRIRDRNSRLAVVLAMACVPLVLQYAFFRDWWAGYSYGTRFLTDVAAVAALLLVYVIPSNLQLALRRNRSVAAATAIFTLTFLFSVTVQFAGVNSGAAGSEWNAVPISIDRSPDRVWQLTDSQIERNIRAAYYRFFAWNIAASARPDRAPAVHVRSISPSFTHVAEGSLINASAVLGNDGRARIYGYDTGVYLGQVRLNVRIVDRQNETVSDQYLYVTGAPASGEKAAASGTIAMPAQAGRYVLECRPVFVGDETADKPGTPFRAAISVGAASKT